MFCGEVLLLTFSFSVGALTVVMWQQAGKDMKLMGAPRAAKTDKERLTTGFWNRIESNQATDCNTYLYLHPLAYGRANKFI